MSNYHRNKALARTHTTKPSMADQAGAAATDINLIVSQFLRTNQAPGSSKAPQFGDFSNFPKDLRETIETSRAFYKLRRDLPDALREKPLEELLALTPEQLTHILTPPATPPAEMKEEPPK